MNGTIVFGIILILLGCLITKAGFHELQADRAKKQQEATMVAKGMPPGYTLVCKDGKYRASTGRILLSPYSKRDELTRENAILRAWGQYEYELNRKGKPPEIETSEGWEQCE